MKLRYLLNVILSFMLSIAFVCLSFLTVVRCNYNSHAIYRILDSGKYYDKVLLEMERNAEMIPIPTGLPLGVLEGVFLAEEVHRDINSYIKALYKDDVFQVEGDALKQRLEDQVKHYLGEERISPDRRQDPNIDRYIEAVTEVYNESIRMPLLEYINRLIKNYQVYYNIAMGICSGVALLIIFLLYQLEPLQTRFFYNIYNSTMAAALMLAIVPILLLIDRFYTKLRISPVSISIFVNDYISSNLHTLLGVSIFFGVISLIFLRQRAKYR